MGHQKPTKQEIEQLIRKGEAWDESNDKRIYIDPLNLKPTDSLMPVLIDDIPAEYVEMSRRIVASFASGTFPHLERVIKDAGDPHMSEVLVDLRRAERMV